LLFPVLTEQLRLRRCPIFRLQVCWLRAGFLLQAGKWVKIIEWADANRAKQMIVEAVERAK